MELFEFLSKNIKAIMLQEEDFNDRLLPITKKNKLPSTIFSYPIAARQTTRLSPNLRMSGKSRIKWTERCSSNSMGVSRSRQRGRASWPAWTVSWSGVPISAGTEIIPRRPGCKEVCAAYLSWTATPSPQTSTMKAGVLGKGIASWGCFQPTFLPR